MELRDLRRIIAYMVVSGFSLLELRKLYLDELWDFYGELFFTLEKKGELKEGSYDKLKAVRSGKDDQDRATVKDLRKQLFGIVSNKK